MLTKELKEFLLSILKELKLKNNYIDSIFVFSISNNIFIKIFYEEIDSEINSKIEKSIWDYIYYYYKYKLDCEKVLSKELIKKIKNYIGYNTALTIFNLDILPKRMQDDIDNSLNKIFPSIDIKFLPKFLKITMPHYSEEV